MLSSHEPQLAAARPEQEDVQPGDEDSHKGGGEGQG